MFQVPGNLWNERGEFSEWDTTLYESKPGSTCQKRATKGTQAFQILNKPGSFLMRYLCSQDVCLCTSSCHFHLWKMSASKTHKNAQLNTSFAAWPTKRWTENTHFPQKKKKTLKLKNFSFQVTKLIKTSFKKGTIKFHPISRGHVDLNSQPKQCIFWSGKSRKEIAEHI